MLVEIAEIFICSVPTKITWSTENSVPSSTSTPVSELSNASARREVAFVVPVSVLYVPGNVFVSLKTAFARYSDPAPDVAVI